MSKILVIGATGNVGAEVIKALGPSNFTVVAAVRDIGRAKARLGDAIEYVVFDFKQPATFKAAFEGVQKVFLVRPPDISNAKKYIAPAIEAAKQAGVKHVTFLSLLGVEKNRVVPHYKIEQLLLTSGLDWTFLRASFFMQNLNTAQRDDIKEHSDIFVPAGKGKTSFIDVRDIAAVAAKSLTEDGHVKKAYDLTGKVALDYYEVAGYMTVVLGRTVGYSNPSPLKFFGQMRQRKQPIAFILVMIALYTTARFGLAGRVTPDTEKLLGRPPIGIRQYIEDYKPAWL